MPNSGEVLRIRIANFFVGPGDRRESALLLCEAARKSVIILILKNTVTVNNRRNFRIFFHLNFLVLKTSQRFLHNAIKAQNIF